MEREPKLFSAADQNKKVLEEPSVSDVAEKGDGYEIKLNGDIVWPCPECDKNGIIKADNKYYGYHRSNTDKLKDRKCTACFTKGNEKNDDVQERISWNSSVNNAVHSLGVQEKINPLEIEMRAKIIYEIIKNGNTR